MSPSAPHLLTVRRGGGQPHPHLCGTSQPPSPSAVAGCFEKRHNSLLSCSFGRIVWSTAPSRLGAEVCSHGSCKSLSKLCRVGSPLLPLPVMPRCTAIDSQHGSDDTMAIAGRISWEKPMTFGLSDNAKSHKYCTRIRALPSLRSAADTSHTHANTRTVSKWPRHQCTTQAKCKTPKGSLAESLHGRLLPFPFLCPELQIHLSIPTSSPFCALGILCINRYIFG